MKKSILIGVVFSMMLIAGVNAQDTFQVIPGEDYGPADAVAIRVIPNPQRLSPLLWYQENVPNPGNPSPLTVDGYPAVRDGRSIYIAGTNYSEASAQLYSNIYLISHSQGARSEVQNVFNSFINSFQLNTNIDSVQDREKIRRDMKRANDLNDIRRNLELYRGKTGAYPAFEAGSYIPNTTYSTWPSWQSTLGNMLGIALPIDPVNEFSGCPEGTDEKTCWNVQTREFVCPPRILAYIYQASEDKSTYILGTNYEYGGPGNWQDQSLYQTTLSQCLNFTVSTTGDKDGDGVADTVDNCPDIYNPNQEDDDNDGIGTICDPCPNDGTNDQDNDGICGLDDNCPTIGNPDQTDLDNDGIGDVCDNNTCGNNLMEGTEKCDGQSGVGSFQRCSSDCNELFQQTYCGDGETQTVNDQGQEEQCDGNEETAVCSQTINGYRAEKTRLCQNTCRFTPWSSCIQVDSCGDGIINGLETCDNGLENGVLCQTEYGQTCEFCSGICRVEYAEGPKCGDGIIQSEQGEECDDGAIENGKVCVPGYGRSCSYCTKLCKIDTRTGSYCGDGIRDQIYEACDTTLPSSISCGNEPTYLYKDRICQIGEDYPNEIRCQWSEYGECTARGSCGDGRVNWLGAPANAPEECDDAINPQLCENCRYKETIKNFNYKISGDSYKQIFILAPKAVWEVGYHSAHLFNNTSREATKDYEYWIPSELAYAIGNNATQITLTVDITYPDGVNKGDNEFIFWVNSLPETMQVNTVIWWDVNCGRKSVILKKNGQEVADYDYYHKAGKNCDGGDNVISILPFNGESADEVLTVNGNHSSVGNGGMVGGRLETSQNATVKTSDGIKVIDKFVNYNFDQAIYPDTYSVSVDNTDGIMIWMGNSFNTSYEQRVADNSIYLDFDITRGPFILACVDADNNKVCDYTQF